MILFLWLRQLFWTNVEFLFSCYDSVQFNCFLLLAETAITYYLCVLAQVETLK